jgi:ubiquinone/menaquinone biosynthesis C-methylase UbiE
MDPYRYSAALYDFVVGPLTVGLQPVRMKLAPPIQGMRVLDVGCGTGSDLKLYHQAGCDVYGVDLSPAMLRVARRKFGKSADLHLCDAAQMPFQDESFDLVLSTYTLHEIPHEHRSLVVHEMIRVVKLDGWLLLTDFLPGPYRFPAGWMNRALVLILELGAGREHLKRGRDFLRRGGLERLIKLSQLTTEGAVSVGTGTVGFFLLSTRQSHSRSIINSDEI